MEGFEIYNDIAKRTNGDIYVGVVGPVRTGKSTFISKFMETSILNNITNDYEKQRTIDEMPQSGAGRNVMTMQPKFVPSEAVKVNFSKDVSANVRLVDCVGYLVDGASGFLDGDKPRMVKTLWSDEEITFKEVTTGAHDDFKKATNIARKMVTEYGMSSLGPMMLDEPSENTFLGRDYTKSKNFSDIVAHEIDEEMRSIINSCYNKTKKIISDNKDLLDLIANTLLEVETITKEQIEYLVEHKHLPKNEEVEEIEEQPVKEEKNKKKKNKKED